MNIFKKKPLGFIYLEGTQLTYYPRSGSPVTFRFPAEAIQELELINEDLYTKELTNFILTHKLSPTITLIIIGIDLLYEKDIPDDPNDSQQGAERLHQVKLFLDAVPFEETCSKNYKIDKGLKVIATNKHIVEATKQVLDRQGFLITGVVPFTMLGKDIPASSGMHQDIVKKIFSQFEIVKQNTMLEEAGQTFLYTNGQGQHHIQLTTEVQSKREYLLIGIFAGLLAILGGVSYMNFFASAPPRKVASFIEKSIPTATPIVVASPSANVTPELFQLYKKEAVRIQINGGSSLQGDILKQQLLASGFATIAVKPGSVPATGRARVIFTQSFPMPEREAILAELKKNLFQVAVQEAELSDADIIINL